MEHSSGQVDRQLFVWRSLDLRSELPDGWRDVLIDVAEHRAVRRTLRPTSVTSREDTSVRGLDVAVVDGEVVAREAPWLLDLYRTRLREIAQTLFRTTVVCAASRKIALNLNIQRGAKERYEAHIDSNPIQCLLYVTTHSPGDGGELVVANRHDAVGVDEIDSDCSVIYPIAGHIVFFDARRHPHYVRPLVAPGVRIVAAMNFYTDDATELQRPPDLDEHLYGEAKV